MVINRQSIVLVAGIALLESQNCTSAHGRRQNTLNLEKRKEDFKMGVRPNGKIKPINAITKSKFNSLFLV